MQLDNEPMPQHSVARYGEELDSLKGLVLRMAGAIEQRISKILEAMVEGSSEPIQWVAHSDSEINKLEIEIDEMTISILARRQPVAVDLRVLTTVLKINTDFERIGDEIQRIARVMERFDFEMLPREIAETLRHLGQEVVSMVRDAADSFARADTELATRTCKQDKIADKDYKILLEKHLPNYMHTKNTRVSILDILWCARGLERIGDHAKNIAEQVIYMVKAKDVRHSHSK